MDAILPMHLVLAPTALPMLLVSAAILLLGVAVIARERANAVTLSFVVLTLTVSVWLASVGLMAMVTDSRSALVLARIAYVGIALIPAAVLQFTMALLNRGDRRALTAAWSTGVAFVILFTTTNLLLGGVYRYSWGFYPRLSDAALLFLAYFTIVLAGSLYALGRAGTATGRERLRNRSFFRALSIGYLGSIDYLPAFGIAVYPIGCVAILGFIILAARAVRRFHLSDLTAAFVADHVLQTMHGGVIVVDTRGRVRVANDVAAKLLGCTTADLRDLDLPSFLGTSVLPGTDSESFARRSITRDRVVKWPRKDGTLVELSMSASAIREEEGDALGVLYALSDVSAMHDMLTAVPNRTRFGALFEEAKMRIIASHRVPSILFIDLDGFKAINDQHGHAAGDTLLQLVAKRIRNSIRGDDIIARYAGDEFVVLVDLAKEDDATFVASKLIRVVAEPYSIEDKTMSVGASVGCAFYPVDGETLDDLLRAADRAMYAAKRAGKGRLHVSKHDKPSPPTYIVNATA